MLFYFNVISNILGPNTRGDKHHGPNGALIF